MLLCSAAANIVRYLQYLSHLQAEYKLRKLPKPKPLITGVDDLYHLLYALWVLDDSVFADEHQRTMASTGILAGVYFGVRLVSLFDTRVKIDDPGHTADVCHKGTGEDDALDGDWTSGEDAKTHRGARHAVADDGIRRSERKGSDAPVHGSDISIKSGSDGDSDGDIDMNSCSGSEYVSDGESDIDGATESDTGSIKDDDFDEDSCTDDDYDGGAEETGAFLYRHFSIFLVPNPIPGKPNIIFMKATLLHTKGEDNNPRM